MEDSWHLKFNKWHFSNNYSFALHYPRTEPSVADWEFLTCLPSISNRNHKLGIIRCLLQQVHSNYTSHWLKTWSLIQRIRLTADFWSCKGNSNYVCSNRTTSSHLFKKKSAFIPKKDNSVHYCSMVQKPNAEL